MSTIEDCHIYILILKTAINNDIAQVLLKFPLIFNRWVQPICIPKEADISNSTKYNWQHGPQMGTDCVVVSICRFVKSSSIFMDIRINFRRLDGAEWENGRPVSKRAE